MSYTVELPLMQRSLFELPRTLRSRVITRRADFDSLFEGYPTVRAISYIASPELLLDLFEKPGFDRVELILGDSLAPLSREALATAGVDVVERLSQLVEQGKLHVYLPTKTIHSKLYILSGNEGTRVVVTSANLTLVAREATRQTNYAWVAEFAEGDAWLGQVENDFAAHKKGCSLFLGELLELFRQQTEPPRRQIIEAWLTGAAVPEATQSQSAKLLGEVAEWALDPARAAVEPIFVTHLPESSASRKQTEKILGRFGAILTGDSIRSVWDGGIRGLTAHA